MALELQKLASPGYFRENRLDAHSDHARYRTDDERALGESTFLLSLNGAWKFFYALNFGQVPAGFESADFDCRDWADIAVPAHVQMEGYGIPQYCNTQYPWDGAEAIEPGEIPQRFNPVACYVKYFCLPEKMRGERVCVSFQGAESCVAVWLNGHYIGFGSDSFTPDEFDLTDCLVEGENKLACQVVRFSAGSWLEDQDFMRFSGLFRDVYLYSKPRAHLRDLTVKTLLDAAYRDAVLSLDLDIEGEAADAALTLVRGGQAVAQARVMLSPGCTHVELPVSNPDKWSSEQPNLYELRVALSGADGALIELSVQKVGFRAFELKDGVMCVNGVRVVFKGVNRHDYCAETGRAVTREKVRRDLVTMKRNNINAIRTSHYPNNSALYALCDELGLYVIDENNMETHGIWERIMRGEKPIEYALPGNRPEWRDILLDRVESTYRRDRNHPCVLIWSCGNESFGGDVILDMSRRFHELDDTRLVHYEGVHWDPRRPETTDIASQMYTPVEKVRAYLSEHRDKPFILCEYTHSMGNSNGGMHLYTEYAYEEKLYQGGFIWDFLDQTTLERDRLGRETLAYGGDRDERPHDGNFSGNGIVFGDGSPTPKLQAVKCNYQNIVCRFNGDAVTVVNRSMFTGTSAFLCTLTLARDGVEIERATLDTCVPPLSERSYPLPFARRTLPGEYAVTASFRLREDAPWADMGYEVAFGQGVYRVAGEQPAQPVRPLRIVRGSNNLGVYGDGFSALFSTIQGGMISYRVCGRELLKNVPMPEFWRAPTDNDRGWGMPQRLGQWKLASMYATHRGTPEMFGRSLESMVEEGKDGGVSIRFDYLLPLNPAARCDVTYAVSPAGRVTVTVGLEADAPLGEIPAFGMSMKLCPDCDRVEWYGLGPEENYADRQSGARLGLWKKRIADNVTRYPRPQECGTVTGVRWAKVVDAKGRGLRFVGDSLEFSALPYTAHELENALHHGELPPPVSTVVRVLRTQLGVAGDDSWGARPLEAYIPRADARMTFTFAFEAVV